nr:MAG TPA_asm: hypothetical protein [Caudoviricetes sp.]
MTRPLLILIRRKARTESPNTRLTPGRTDRR